MTASRYGNSLSYGALGRVGAVHGGNQGSDTHPRLRQLGDPQSWHCTQAVPGARGPCRLCLQAVSPKQSVKDAVEEWSTAHVRLFRNTEPAMLDAGMGGVTKVVVAW